MLFFFILIVFIFIYFKVVILLFRNGIVTLYEI